MPTSPAPKTKSKRTLYARPSLPTYISLGKASKISGMEASVLQEKISAGRIRAVTVDGTIAVSKSDVAPTRKEDLPEYKQFAHLKSKPIWVAEAGRKYDTSFQNIANWVKAGYIQRLEKQGNKVMLDEQDVAYCVCVYKQNAGQGKRIFNPDGTPYTSKRPQTA